MKMWASSEIYKNAKKSDFHNLRKESYQLTKEQINKSLTSALSYNLDAVWKIRIAKRIISSLNLLWMI